jgi:hypothetical protein
MIRVLLQHITLFMFLIDFFVLCMTGREKIPFLLTIFLSCAAKYCLISIKKLTIIYYVNNKSYDKMKLTSGILCKNLRATCRQKQEGHKMSISRRVLVKLCVYI